MLGAKQMIKKIGMVMLIAWLVVIAAEWAIVRPQNIAIAMDEFVKEFDIYNQIEVAKKGEAYNFYYAGPSIFNDCGQEGFPCFDWEKYKNVKTIIALAPRGANYNLARVLRNCDVDACTYLEKFDVYLRPANSNEEILVRTETSISEHVCRNSTIWLYEYKFCRHDIRSGTSIVSSNYYINISKPISFGFLMFDQEYVTISTLDINFVTGDVVNIGYGISGIN